MSLSTPAYPDTLAIEPLRNPPQATVRVPGSKSFTNRALVLAAINGGCELTGALQSEDTEVMITALRTLGHEISTDWPRSSIALRTEDRGPVPAAAANLFVANSGTSMRFLTALVSLGKGRYRIDGVPHMRERPIEDLLAALRQLGVKADSEAGNGCPPVVIEATGTCWGSRPCQEGTSAASFLAVFSWPHPGAGRH